MLLAMLRQGVVAVVITYSTLIGASEKGKQPKQVLEMSHAMQQQSVMPNVITYSALISACDKSRQPDRTLEVFKSMQHQACQWIRWLRSTPSMILA